MWNTNQIAMTLPLYFSFPLQNPVLIYFQRDHCIYTPRYMYMYIIPLKTTQRWQHSGHTVQHFAFFT